MFSLVFTRLAYFLEVRGVLLEIKKQLILNFNAGVIGASTAFVPFEIILLSIFP
jgi:hypothetical protein